MNDDDSTKGTVRIPIPAITEQHARQSAVATTYFDSLEWMRTALQKDLESRRSAQEPTYLNALKVSQVCCGFALELAYKALLYAQSKQHSKKMEKHFLSLLHDMLDSPEKETIERVAGELLVNHDSPFAPRSGRAAIRYIDEYYTHPDIKYWGKRATVDRSNAIVASSGLPMGSDDELGSIAAMQKLHHLILDLARRRTWPANWNEYQCDASLDQIGQQNQVMLGPLMGTAVLTDENGDWVGEWVPAPKISDKPVSE